MTKPDEQTLKESLTILDGLFRGEQIYVIRQSERDNNIIRNLVGSILDLSNIEFDIQADSIKTPFGKVTFTIDNSLNNAIISSARGEI